MKTIPRKTLSIAIAMRLRSSRRRARDHGLPATATADAVPGVPVTRASLMRRGAGGGRAEARGPARNPYFTHDWSTSQ